MIGCAEAAKAAYEATYLAVFHSPDSAGSLVYQYCVNYPDYTLRGRKGRNSGTTLPVR